MLEGLLKTKDEVFEILRDLTPLKVLHLWESYVKLFPESNEEEIVIDTVPLSHLETYTFDPLRVISLARAVQDAVRKTANLTDGPI